MRWLPGGNGRRACEQYITFVGLASILISLEFNEEAPLAGDCAAR
jgi:hypothetical protein